MAKHVMLSYNWDIQSTVEKVYEGLRKRGINTWMDIKEGGMKGDINSSMAEAVDGAACICCFMSTKYQESKNCKRELTYGDSQGVAMVPAMSQKDYKATGWLGILTAGLLWIDFRDVSNFDVRVDSLAKEIVHQASGDIYNAIKTPQAKTAIVQKKPGRAFRHKLTGKYLAETGQVKFHPASGNRNTLAVRDKPEDTSYWVEERQKKSEIYYYKNYATNGYLGYDPNGDYTYTKGQHYGAEEWTLEVDTQSSSGEREVVLFANFGKKYLAIRDGKFTGVASKSADCIWILA